MTTFIDPVKIRRLAATGDPFWKGAAWVLDQQAAQAEARTAALSAQEQQLRKMIGEMK